MVPAINVILQSPADGHTILLNFMALTIQAAIKKDLPYDVRKDFIPLVRVASIPNVVYVSTESPIKTLEDAIKLSKSKALTVSGFNSGSTSHLTMELLRLVAGLNTIYVPYKDASQQVADALTGRTDMGHTSLGVVQGHISAGKLRAIVYTGSKRFPTISGVPTAIEVLKDPEMDLNSWYGFLVKSGTPKPIVDRLAREISTAAAQPDTKATLEKLALETLDDTQDAFAKRIESDLRRWDRTVREAKLKFD